jgi:hypothetical protein
MKRILPFVAAVMSLGLLVSACSGDSESGSENSPAPIPSTSTTTPGEPETAPSVPEIVEMIPEPVKLTADDLVTGMPTNKQMSMIQGFRFVEEDTWVGGGEGPEWANDAPLTKEQRSQLGLGKVRRTKPEQCMLVSSFEGFGISQELSNQDAITAAAYSKRLNDYQYLKSNLVGVWQSIAFVLPPGQSKIWADDTANLFIKCLKFTVVKNNGDIERVNSTAYYPAGKSIFTSAKAYVIVAKVSPQDRKYFQIVEAIGDVYYKTLIDVYSNEKKTLARAAKAYNVLADNIAEVAQVTREPVDFNKLVPFTPDPEAYVAPEIPLSSGARA